MLVTGIRGRIQPMSIKLTAHNSKHIITTTVQKLGKKVKLINKELIINNLYKKKNLFNFLKYELFGIRIRAVHA